MFQGTNKYGNSKISEDHVLVKTCKNIILRDHPEMYSLKKRHARVAGRQI